jgi:hypothetical protein
MATPLQADEPRPERTRRLNLSFFSPTTATFFILRETTATFLFFEEKSPFQRFKGPSNVLRPYSMRGVEALE